MGAVLTALGSNLGWGEKCFSSIEGNADEVRVSPKGGDFQKYMLSTTTSIIVGPLTIREFCLLLVSPTRHHGPPLTLSQMAWAVANAIAQADWPTAGGYLKSMPVPDAIEALTSEKAITAYDHAQADGVNKDTVLVKIFQPLAGTDAVILLRKDQTNKLKSSYAYGVVAWGDTE